MPLDPNRLQRIISATRRTPTPENSQPWRIIVDDHQLLFFHDSARAKLATFPDDLSVMGVGMLQEAVRLAASRERMAVHFQTQLTARDDHTPWLVATLQADADTPPDPLADALELRHTDRRRYAGGSRHDPIFAQLTEMSTTLAGTAIYCIDHYPADYRQLLQQADQSVMAWDEMRHDMGRWVRFTHRATQRSRDGMPWQSLLRGEQRWWHYLQTRLWWLATRIDWFPESLMALEQKLFDDSGQLTPSDFSDGAALGCVTVNSDTPEALVTAGRFVMRLWLLLNQQGYALQPLTNLVSITYPRQLGTFDLPPEVRHLVSNDYAILQQTYGFGDGELPIFTFRTGLAASPYPNHARTLRLEQNPA